MFSRYCSIFRSTTAGRGSGGVMNYFFLQRFCGTICSLPFLFFFSSLLAILRHFSNGVTTFLAVCFGFLFFRFWYFHAPADDSWACAPGQRRDDEFTTSHRFYVTYDALSRMYMADE
ncbi:hypothetical protein J3F83DRAFT_400990 [Trichoderma novae-zelandiae]